MTLSFAYGSFSVSFIHTIHLLIVDNCVYANGVLFGKSLPAPMSSREFLTFSSIRSNKSGFSVEVFDLFGVEFCAE